jgi:uncharacterized protein YndB with AHSA1/START domain
VTAGAEFRSVRVERVLPARPEVVYDAWLDEGSLRKFMCPAPGQATEVAVDARLGGALRVVMTFPDRETEITGNFIALDRPERVSFTWRSDFGDPESIVTVLFAPHGEDQTHMTIIHTLPPSSPDRGYQGGWTSIAERVADHLAG